MRTIACIIYWIFSFPIRLGFGVLATVFVIPGIPFWFLMDLKKWGCDGECMSDWNDWSFLDIPKLLYWDFVICGRFDL